MSDVPGDTPRKPPTETTHDARDLWRVQLGTGEIRVMTLDALDAAFENGVIDERTPVLAPFAPTWSTLGIVAGLDETQPDLTPSLSPVALSAPPPMPRVAATTDRPVAFDTDSPLDLDLPEASEMRPRKGLVIGVVATSIVGLIGLPILITSITGTPPVDVKATSVAAQLPPAVSPLPPSKAAEEAAAKEAAAKEASAKEAAAKEAATKEAQPAAVSSRQLLDEDQKKQLLEADKAREEKSRKAAADKAAAAANGGGAAPKRRPEKAAPALLNGGDRFDPLNGAL